MLRLLAIFGLLLASIAPAMADCTSTDNLIHESNTLADKQKFKAALTLLNNARTCWPDSPDLELERARLLSWKGDYPAAEKTLAHLPASYQQDYDVLFVRASLYFYEKHYPQAIAILRKIQKNAPHDPDVNETLRLATEALHDRLLPWAVGYGIEISHFSRVPLEAWYQEYLILSRQIDDTTSVYAKTTRMDYFSERNSGLELGASHIFSPYIHAYGSVAYEPNASFSPRYAYTFGGAVRPHTKANRVSPFELLLDTGYSVYPTTHVLTVSPGVGLHIQQRTVVSTSHIQVYQSASLPMYGQQYKVDRAFSAKASAEVGYVDAPDTENGVTVKTHTYFGEASIDLTPRATLHFGYTHDNRYASYIREAENANITYKF